MNDGTFLIIHQHGQYEYETKTILAAIPFGAQFSETYFDALKRACTSATRAVRLLCSRKFARATAACVEGYPNGAAPEETREQYAHRIWLSLTNVDDDDAVLVVKIPALHDGFIDEIFKPKRDNPNELEAEDRFEQVVRRYPVEPSLYWDAIPLEPLAPEQVAQNEAKRRLLLERLEAATPNAAAICTSGLLSVEQITRPLPVEQVSR